MSQRGAQSRGERFYRLLLFAYPQPFRQMYRRAMLEYFRARHPGARASIKARLRFWAFVLRDLFINAVAEWRGVLPKRQQRRAAPNVPGPPHQRRPGKGGSGPGDGVMQDLRYAVRRLVKEPLFSIAAIAIVAVGIGVNTAMFTVVDGFLLRPRPWQEPDRLVFIYQDADDGDIGSNSFPAYVDMSAHTDVFSQVTATMSGWSGGWMRESGTVRQVSMAAVTSNYFSTLGLHPLIGRAFDGAEDQAIGPAAAIINHRTWQRELMSDPDMLGRTIPINGVPVTIVGVGPEGYGGLVPGRTIDFWVSISSIAPLQGPYIAGTLTRRGDHWFDVIARLRPGVTVDQARAAMALLANRLATEYPSDNAGRGITVHAASEVRVHPDDDRLIYPAGAVLMAVVGLVLLVACANLANLMLARSATRAKEMAVRAAVGASRGRLVQQLLLENLLLAGAGGLLGVVAADRLIRLVSIQQTSLLIPVNAVLAVDARIISFAMGLTMLTGIAFGLVPAIRASRPELVASLRDRDNAGSVRRSRIGLGLKELLVVSQVAVSLVLLVGAGLLIRSLQNSYAVDLGIDTRRLALIQPHLGQAGYDQERTGQFYDDVLARIRALPQIEVADLTSRLPLQRAGSSTLLFDEPAAAVDERTVEVDFAWVGPTFLQTVGLGLLRGRHFSSADAEQATSLAIVSETMAQRYFGSVDAVGRRFRYQSYPDSPIEIIGVVQDSKVRSTGEPPTPFFYRLIPRNVGNRHYVVARTSGDPAVVAGSMQREVRVMDPAIPVYAVHTMDDHIDLALVVSRTAASALTGVGVFALLLAIFGLYAIVSFTVSRRTAEVGIRKALGARSGEVTGMLVREVILLVGAGIATGIGLSMLATPVLESLLIGVPPIDVVTISLVSLAMAVAAGVAASIPAALAAKTDPLVALRHE